MSKGIPKDMVPLQGEITTREAAKILRCSPRTILRMIDRRSLHARKLDPNAKSVYRLDRQEVEALRRTQHLTSPK